MVAPFENWGDSAGNHFQSFAVTVSNKVFFSSSFQMLWSQYLPGSSRLHAIEEGEKKLSNAIMKSADDSKVLYTCAKLATRLSLLKNNVRSSDLNRPGFTGEHFVQNLRCFFKGVQVFVESFLRFSWREISDSTVDAFCVVPIDPFQRFPFQLANGFPGAE